MAGKDYMDTNTKDLIAEALRRIMMEKPFESIRIKDICDRVGVVRVTFYNYFIDKYAALEYLIQKDLIFPNEQRIRDGKLEEMVYAMMHEIDAQRDYYRVAYQIEGQNGFADQMLQLMSGSFGRILDRYRHPAPGVHTLPNKVVSDYFAEMFTYGMRTWIFYPGKVSYSEAVKYVYNVIRTDVLEYLNGK